MRMSRIVGLALAALVARAAAATECTPVSGTVQTAFTAASCTSPVGLCTVGTVDAGALSGASAFSASSAQVRGAVTLFSGVFVVQTSTGPATFATDGVLNNVTGRYVERFTGIAGPFDHASFVSTGAATPAGFQGTLTGAVCR